MAFNRAEHPGLFLAFVTRVGTLTHRFPPPYAFVTLGLLRLTPDPLWGSTYNTSKFRPNTLRNLLLQVHFAPFSS